MSHKVRDIDAFIAVSHYFKKVMQNNMQIPGSKIFAVPIGVDPDLYTVHLPAKEPQAIGYLSRMNEDNGFGILVDAFIRLKKNPRYSSTKLIITGGKTGDDKPYIAEQIKKLQKSKLLDYIEFIEFGEKCKTYNMDHFFKKISVLSVPVVNGEAFGLYLLEALASGIPVVQPALGAFPEIVTASNGGSVYSPNTAAALCEKWEEVLGDTDRLNTLSKHGRQAVEELFNLKKTTAQLVEIYSKF